MLTILRDLLKHDGRFRVAFVFLLAIVVLSLLSFVSPYDPGQTFMVPPDMPPSAQHLFGTSSRGQDVFWWMAFAVRNSLLLGILTAVISRIIAIFVGLTAGYRGGWADRILMSINDSFVVMPVLPILILLSFLLRGQMSLMMLAFIMGLFGWPWDARLIRSQVLSLKERPFTRTAVYSGNFLFSHHPQRAPALCAARRLCHDHQQSTLVDWDGGHAQCTGAFQCDDPDHRHHDLLGESTSGVGGRHLVVAGCTSRHRHYSLPGAVLTLLQRQRVH